MSIGTTGHVGMSISAACHLGMSQTVNTTSRGNDFHVLQVPSSLGLPSSLFVGCCLAKRLG